MARKVRAIVINEKDNVATALEPLEANAAISIENRGRTEQIIPPAAIPSGHKFALCEINAGEYVIKYGEPIGLAVVRIRPGEHVHVHNIRSRAKGVEGAP
jgi:altronate dehydratase small subunit